jgi:hypothetical protein
MELVPLFVFTFLALTFIVSPYVAERRARWEQQQRELRRCGGKVRPISDAPRFDGGPQHPRPPRGRAA